MFVAEVLFCLETEKNQCKTTMFKILCGEHLFI